MLKVRLVRSMRQAAHGYSGPIARGRTGSRGDRGIFRRGPRLRRHLPLLRRGAALRGAGRERGLCLARRVAGAEGAGLCRRQVPALDLSRRGRAADAVGTDEWPKLPPQVAEWLDLQRAVSVIPRRDQLLVETFPRAERFHLVAYPSRAASPTRPSGCCSPAGWSAAD